MSQLTVAEFISDGDIHPRFTSSCFTNNWRVIPGEEGPPSVQLAAVNPSDKFALVFKHLLETLFVERMDQNEEIFVRYMNDAQFQKVVTAWMAEEAYKRLRDRPDTVMDSEQATTS